VTVSGRRLAPARERRERAGARRGRRCHQNRGGGALTGGPPLQCTEVGQIQFEFKKLIQIKFESFPTLID
jgi:hypothetical protein